MRNLYTILLGILIFSQMILIGGNRPSAHPGIGNNSIPKQKMCILSVVYQHPIPVITVGHPDADGNKFGYEGGRVVKVGKVYHLFTSEMVDNPIWVKMKLGYWTSNDGNNWQRVATIRESSGDFTGTDFRAAFWSPLPVYNEYDKRWHLFYVAYKAKPSDGIGFYGNYAGRIWHAVSQKKGLEGISGPYNDVKIILQPGPDQGAWEGLQGTDSFFPWKVGKEWYAFHGSCKSDTMPAKSWLVGMAKSKSGDIRGPWERLAEFSPSPLENRFIENPIVTEAPGGGWLCVYDSDEPYTIGWAWSADGIHWPKGNKLKIQQDVDSGWCKDIRTPMGLIYEGGNKFTLYYTGFEEEPDCEGILKSSKGKQTCAIGKIALKWE